MARDIKRRERAIPDFRRKQLGATDESPDAETKAIAELNATIAKATKIRQDKHLNGSLSVEDEKLILSGCGDDDSLKFFQEQ